MQINLKRNLTIKAHTGSFTITVKKYWQNLWTNSSAAVTASIKESKHMEVIHLEEEEEPCPLGACLKRVPLILRVPTPKFLGPTPNFGGTHPKF